MKKLLTAIDRIFGFIERYVIIILLNAFMIIMFVNVLGRYTGHAITWAEEVSRMMLVWMTFVAISAAIGKGTHVRITVIPDLFKSDKVRRGFEYLSVIASIVFFSYTTFYGFRYTAGQIAVDQKAAATQISLWLILVAVAVGSLMGTIRYLIKLYEMITGNTITDTEIDDVDANTDIHAVLMGEEENK